MTARLFNLMLCAVLLVLSSPAAKAIARPENRVGGSPVLSTDVASQQSAKPIGTPSENAGCGYDFASGIQKYLYADDDPVNNSDPSGNDVLSARIGTAVHTFLGKDFVKQTFPFGVSGPSIATVLHLPTTITALFPDLVDTKTKEVYEIKPNSIANFALGEAQLEGYIQVLNYFDKRGGWHAGTGDDYRPPVSFMLPAPPTAVVVQRPVFGVILYSTLQDFAKARAKNVAEEEATDEEDSIDISTLTTVIGF